MPDIYISISRVKAEPMTLHMFNSTYPQYAVLEPSMTQVAGFAVTEMNGALRWLSAFDFHATHRPEDTVLASYKVLEKLIKRSPND